MINGAPTDNNAKLFKQGAHTVLDGSGVKIAKEYDTPDWSPDKAQTEMEQAITALGKNNIDGVYAANDGTAGGAIAAMKGNGVDPTKVPITGQDAELAGDPADPRRRAVHDGLQGRSSRRPRRPPSWPSRSATGKKPPASVNEHDGEQRQEGRARRSCFDPVAVTKANVKDTIIKDGFWKPSRDLHRRVRRRLQGRRHPVVTMATETQAGAPQAPAGAGPAPEAARGHQALRRGAGAQRRRLRGQRRRGRRPRGRQRRRQVDAGQDHLRRRPGRRRGRSSWAASRSRSTRPQDAGKLGIATVYQDLALCDNLDVVANLFLGREADRGPSLDEITMEKRVAPSCSTPSPSGP